MTKQRMGVVKRRRVRARRMDEVYYVRYAEGNEMSGQSASYYIYNHETNPCSTEVVVESPLSSKLGSAKELFVRVLLVHVDALKVLLDQPLTEELGTRKDLSLSIARVEDE